MSYDDFKDMDSQVLDVDEIKDVDVKINPDYYIHQALLRAQKVLSSDKSLDDDFSRFIIMVDHIEVLCKAANMIPEDYEADLKKFRESGEFKEVDSKARKPYEQFANQTH